MKPLISVVIAAYNIENYIDKCIESIINQTYQNIEILIVNDGSKDSTLQKAEEYRVKDSRVQILDKVNGGLSDARNYGIEHSNGEFIVFVDGDDYLDSKMIEVLYNTYLQNEADLCICNIQNVDENGNLLDSPSEEEMRCGLHTREEMLDFTVTPPNWYWVVAWNKLYKKSLFDTGLRFAKGKIHEDEFFIHRVLDKCNKVQIIPDKLYYYVQRQNSITHDEYKVSHLDAIEAYLDRADFFVSERKYENVTVMLERARTKLLDGYIALMGNNTKEKKNRIRALHEEYRSIYRKNSSHITSGSNKFLLWLLDKSLVAAVYTSGNYRNTRRK